MQNSNLYIERISAEHPLGCWPLDDDISYNNFIYGDDANFDNWEFSTPPQNIFREPLWDYPNYWASFAVADDHTILSYPNIPKDGMDESKTANLSFWIVAANVSEIIVKAKTAGPQSFTFAPSTLTFISLEFSIDSDDIVPSIEFVISDPMSVAFIQMSQPRISQHAEPFLKKYNGYVLENIPSDILHVINGSGSKRAVMADQYGLSFDPGYFIGSASGLYVKNSGLPLVYSSNNSVTVLPSGGNPAIIVPGKGMLNLAGQHNNYTLEAWVRFHNDSPDPIRLIGPVASSDGIYVDEGFISLSIGPYSKSYFVGKFDRPMLLHLEYSPTRASLLINGEVVIGIDIDPSVISFPAARNGTGKMMDWIGVYGYDSLSNFNIDCISIFPYLVPPEIAKRHFVYGQGVQAIDLSNESLSNKVIQFDYPFAQYAYNVAYPTTSRWYSGLGINLNTTTSTLKPNAYALPAVISKYDIYDGEIQDPLDWFIENRQFNNADTRDLFPYLLMSPSGQASTIYFKSLNVASDKIQSVFMFGRTPDAPEPSQSLLRFNNSVTGEAIDISLDSNDIVYKHISASNVETTLYVEPVDDNEYFTAGIDMKGFSASFYYPVGNFFNDPNRITLNVGGYNSDTFLGKIFGVHFTSKFFYDRDLSDRFNNGVIVQQPGLDSLCSYIGNYSLLPVINNTSMTFDVGSVGYWEDFLPLSMFSKRNDSGNYALDFLQFNIDIPYGHGYGETPGTYYYYQLFELYNLFAYDYEYLNGLWPTYGDIVPSVSDALDSLRYATGFKSYITIQPVATVGTNLYSSYDAVDTYVDGVVTPTDFTKKYQVYDNTIIKLPADFDFNNYYIGIHFEMMVRGTTNKSMMVRKMELASFAANDGETPIGTKYAYPVYVETT